MIPTIDDARQAYSWLRATGRPTAPDAAPPPTSVEDDEGRGLWLAAAVGPGSPGDRTDDFEALVETFLDFDRTQRSLGVPPTRESDIHEWLETLLAGPAVVAWHDERAVGLVAFVPDEDGGHELAVFVHQDYQRAGIGTRLLRTGLAHADRAGAEKVWLTVEARRGGLQQLYRTVGFSVVESWRDTRKMALRF